MREIRIDKGAGQLDLSLPTDIIKYHVVPILNASHGRASSIGPDDRFERLVVIFPFAIGLAHGLGH